MIVSEFMNSWLENKKADLQLSTYEAYTVYLSKHINPYFDKLNKPLEALKPIDIKNYVTAKRNGGRKDNKKGGLSHASVQKHLNVIKQALKEAVLLEYIASSPASYVTLPRKNNISEKARFISIAEAIKIQQAFKGHFMFPLVCITLMYGLRRSEVLGLKWSAIDFENRSLEIKHTVVKNLTIEAKNSTKTESSHRTFPLLNDAIEVLKNIPRSNNSKDSYVFSRADGTPLRPDSVTRTFQRVLKANGLEKMRFHDLRHATASILFDKEWSVADVQHWLGHTDIETTMNIYVKYNCTRKLKVGGALEGLFLTSQKVE